MATSRWRRLSRARVDLAIPPTPRTPGSSSGPASCQRQWPCGRDCNPADSSGQPSRPRKPGAGKDRRDTGIVNRRFAPGAAGDDPVGRYLRTLRPRRGGRRSQRWATFVRNHAHAVVACDFFTTVTVRFRILYVFVVLEVGTRRILHWNVTEHPTAEWTIQQFRAVITPETSHRFVLHDRDSIYAALCLAKTPSSPEYGSQKPPHGIHPTDEVGVERGSASSASVDDSTS